MSTREYPVRPVLGVAGVIFQGDAVLLARRGKEPSMGEWSLPGGVVELGETLASALERELLEEVSVRIQVGGFVHFVERVIRDPKGKIQYHYVIAEYWGRLEGGRIEPASDVTEARLAPVSRLGELDLHPDVIWTIQEALELRNKNHVGG